jgi:alkylhydroperoxidase family enzyme
LAKQKGASQEQVDGVRDFENASFTGREKVGFRCADRLHRSPHEIDDAFYADLKSVFNDKEIIELTATAAAFEFFTRFVDALRIPTTPLPGPDR